MITIDIDILNNLKVLKTILGEIDEEHSWRICFNATPENEHWKDYPNKCARYFTFDMERRVFSWKCHDNLAPADTTHLATPGHALEFLENIFSIQDRIIDKNVFVNNEDLSEKSGPDITASVSAPDPKPTYPSWAEVGGDALKYPAEHKIKFKPVDWTDHPNYESPYHGSNHPKTYAKDDYYDKNPYKYDVYGNPMPVPNEMEKQYHYYSKVKDQIFSCKSLSDIMYIYQKLVGKHDHVSEKLMDLLMNMKKKIEHYEYTTNVWASYGTGKSISQVPMVDYSSQFVEPKYPKSKYESIMDEMKAIASKTTMPMLTAQQVSESFTKTKSMTALSIESTHKELSAAAKQIADEIDSKILQSLMLKATHSPIKPEF